MRGAPIRRFDPQLNLGNPDAVKAVHDRSANATRPLPLVSPEITRGFFVSQLGLGTPLPAITPNRCAELLFYEVTMSEKKESLWLVSRHGKDGRIFRSRASARLFKSRKPVPADYAVEPVKWGPERMKAR